MRGGNRQLGGREPSQPAFPNETSSGVPREPANDLRIVSLSDPRHGGPERRNASEYLGVGSPQTLSEPDRRLVAVWAADCAERVLGLFEAEAPGDSRPRDAIARLRAFARGELGVGEARRRFVAHAAVREVSAPVAVAAARAAGQAASIPHMGAHALGAAAYTAKAAGLAAPDRPEAVSEEICWQRSTSVGHKHQRSLIDSNCDTYRRNW